MTNFDADWEHHINCQTGESEEYEGAVQKIADYIAEAQHGLDFDELPDVLKLLIWRDAEEMHKESLGD